MLVCEPVKSEPELRHVYPLLEDACRRIADREGVEFFVPAVYAEIVSGRSRMFVLWDGPEEVGCFVCHVEQDPRAGTPKLIVSLAYAVPGQADDALLVGMARCEEHAADLGCLHVRFYARREGWAKSAATAGFKPTEHVYEKRI